MTFIHRYEPITHCWPLTPDMLLITVQDDLGTAITLTVTTEERIESPGAALVELVHALTMAKAGRRTEGRTP